MSKILASSNKPALDISSNHKVQKTKNTSSHIGCKYMQFDVIYGWTHKQTRPSDRLYCHNSPPFSAETVSPSAKLNQPIPLFFQ